MPQLSSSSSRQRSERRIAVRLPLKVSGRDPRGIPFEEETSSENVCRNGAAFVTASTCPSAADLEIRIPFSQSVARRAETDFATRGRVVHVAQGHSREPAHHRRPVHRPALPPRLPLRIRRLVLSPSVPSLLDKYLSNRRDHTKHEVCPIF